MVIMGWYNRDSNNDQQVTPFIFQFLAISMVSMTAQSQKLSFWSMSLRNFRPFSSIMKKTYLCIQQGSLSIFLTPLCSRKSSVQAMSTTMDLQLLLCTNILNILSAQQVLNLEEVLILLQVFIILAKLESNSAFSKSVSPMMYCTILQSPSFTQRLYLTERLIFSFSLSSQLEFSITDSISWIIDRFLLGLATTDSYTFSMLFFRKSGSYSCYSLNWICDCWICFWEGTSSKRDSVMPFLMTTGSNLGVFYWKVLRMSSQNFLVSRRYLRLWMMLQISFSLELSFQQPLSMSPLFFSSTSFTIMLRGLSLLISSLGLLSMLSIGLLYLILPKSQKALQTTSKFLMPFTFDNFIAWLRQMSTSAKFFIQRWISARATHTSNWLNCMMEFIMRSACSKSEDWKRYFPWQQSRQGSRGQVPSNEKTSSWLFDTFPNQEQNSASKMHILGHSPYSLFWWMRFSTIQMECLTSLLQTMYLKTRLKA